ncbi:unnamed protein product, partial [Phaeothamnion confervicola]
MAALLEQWRRSFISTAKEATKNRSASSKTPPSNVDDNLFVEAEIALEGLEDGRRPSSPKYYNWDSPLPPSGYQVKSPLVTPRRAWRPRSVPNTGNTSDGALAQPWDNLRTPRPARVVHRGKLAARPKGAKGTGNDEAPASSNCILASAPIASCGRDAAMDSSGGDANLRSSSLPTERQCVTLGRMTEPPELAIVVCNALAEAVSLQTRTNTEEWFRWNALRAELTADGGQLLRRLRAYDLLTAPKESRLALSRLVCDPRSRDTAAIASLSGQATAAAVLLQWARAQVRTWRRHWQHHKDSIFQAAEECVEADSGGHQPVKGRGAAWSTADGDPPAATVGDSVHASPQLCVPPAASSWRSVAPQDGGSGGSTSKNHACCCRGESKFWSTRTGSAKNGSSSQSGESSGEGCLNGEAAGDGSHLNIEAVVATSLPHPPRRQAELPPHAFFPRHLLFSPQGAFRRPETDMTIPVPEPSGDQTPQSSGAAAAEWYKSEPSS